MRLGFINTAHPIRTALPKVPSFPEIDARNTFSHEILKCSKALEKKQAKLLKELKSGPEIKSKQEEITIKLQMLKKSRAMLLTFLEHADRCLRATLGGF